MKRCALYARVSTDDRGQDPETQLAQLRDFAGHRGFEIVGEYVDVASGRRNDRPRFKELFLAARRRQVDVVMVWRYDRFARSMQDLVNALSEFRSLGVDFVSYQENVDTTTPQGELIFGIMASLAQFESQLIGQRVRAGMERARAQGKRISRPTLSPAKRRQIEQLHQADPKRSQRSIAREVGVSHETVRQVVRATSRSPQRPD